jgi:hypothetical protein
MHFANWIALVIAVLLPAVVLVSVLRARRRRRAEMLRHRPAPAALQPHDEAALRNIGKVAADGARSSY